MSSPRSSASKEDHPQLMTDQKKRKRMLSNKESARRSRLRKQQHLDELLDQAARLKNENHQISMQIKLLTDEYFRMETENTILRIQMKELTERLLSANSMIHCVEDICGMSMDIPDQLLEPWQLPCPTQLIIASTNMPLY